MGSLTDRPAAYLLALAADLERLELEAALLGLDWETIRAQAVQRAYTTTGNLRDSFRDVMRKHSDRALLGPR